MNFNENEYNSDIKVVEYFLKSHRIFLDQVLRLPKDDITQDVDVNCIDFFDEFPEYFNLFFSNPYHFIMILKKSMIEAQNMYKDVTIPQENSLSSVVPNFETKGKISIKLTHLPACDSVLKKSISMIDVDSLEKFVCFNGTVIRVGPRKTLEKVKLFRCDNCSEEYFGYSDPQLLNKLVTRTKCNKKIMKTRREPNFSDDFRWVRKFEECGNRKFTGIEGSGKWVDYQEVKVQEPFKTIKAGVIPPTILVLLEDNLVESCKPGDDVFVYGMVMKRWKKALVPEFRPEIEMIAYANRIIVKNKEKCNSFIHSASNSLNPDSRNNEDYNFEEEFEYYWNSKGRTHEFDFEARNHIIKSICPRIYEKNDLKLGLLLCLIGGVTMNQNSSRIRGQTHMLIIGEPGTGKSQFMKYACDLSTRAVYTNGIGSTSAGLTLSFIKEAGEWMIEAGALVLADMGVCCIDEFNLIKKNDCASIHEAMEQQTISASKAGITTRVNSRATILAACNPVCLGQKYDPNYTIIENSGLLPTIISRFDLIFTLIDDRNQELDSKNCDFILKKFRNVIDVSDTFEDSDQPWELYKLRAYIKYVQEKFEPTSTEDADSILLNYYTYLRNFERNGRATVRALESLLRLSQAHARLMFRDRIERMDAISIIALMECASPTGLLNSYEFFELINIDYESYLEIDYAILGKLGLREKLGMFGASNGEHNNGENNGTH